MSSGTVAGTVKDSGGSVLAGALIELQPTGKKAVSDSTGEFRIPDVGPGQYTIGVSYVGFSSFSSTIAVASGQTANVDVTLSVASQTEQVIVTAEEARGEAEAINIERTAENIVQVLPSEVLAEYEHRGCRWTAA